MFKNVEDLYFLCKHRLLISEKQLKEFIDPKLENVKCITCIIVMNPIKTTPLKIQYRCKNCQKNSFK
ncbi:hypothetical protein H312_02370 [Anncaliia algerae PRA339]|uniref:Uncharacterized protein n=1 Tax=Anncaliia algerae PRA339 TaxID=1288291 RepID=A0A059EZ72_9MICR|nr:hypothetical protein H312_02370 [Anncaliia algerae PRA339]